MRPGAIEFTVIFLGPTSLASVFAQPMTPGRTEFERARLSIGSRAALGGVLVTGRVAGPRGGGKADPGRGARREDQQLDGLFDVLVGEPDCGRAGRAAAVVDEDVDSAERLERAVDEGLEVGGVRDVAAHGEGASA